MNVLQLLELLKLLGLLLHLLSQALNFCPRCYLSHYTLHGHVA